MLTRCTWATRLSNLGFTEGSVKLWELRSKGYAKEVLRGGAE
jgi:hypothetical protein